MNRQEHLQWCKDRANEYVTDGDGEQAMTSMISDLRKHPETTDSVQMGFMLMMATNSQDLHEVKRFVDGFN